MTKSFSFPFPTSFCGCAVNIDKQMLINQQEWRNKENEEEREKARAKLNPKQTKGKQIIVKIFAEDPEIGIRFTSPDIYLACILSNCFQI